MASIWIVACSGDAIVDPPVVLPNDAIVSDPVPTPALTRSAAVAVGASLAFVSVPPGTIPNGATAVIRNRRASGTLTTMMMNGGFDPVPVEADPGDTVEIRVAVPGGAPITLTRAVPERRQPIVVRADPPPRKRDVPLNSVMVLVFSEPIDPATLSTSSVRLVSGSTIVAGTASLLVGSSTAVAFAPDVPLNANTDYELVVTPAVRDVGGDALGAETRVAFATGTTIEGPVASVAVFPDSGEVVVGSQYQLSATALDAEGNVIIGRPISWTTFDSSVASISAAGLVSAVGQGIASFQAEIEGRIGYATLNVSAVLASVASIMVTPESGSVFVGRTLTLTGEARDSAGNLLGLRPISWTTSSSNVATVVPSAERGRAIVTGRAPGVAAIAAEVEGKRDTSFVTVTAAPPIIGFVVSPDTLSLILRGTGHLTGVATAADGWTGAIDGAEISWSVADPATATVNAGFVTARQVGATTVTATWNGFTATARVGVVSLAFTDVRAGYGRACGLTLDGAAYCWGTNWGNAGLGNGTTNSSPSPVPVSGGLTFTGITVGGYHSCGLTSNGLAHCWGYNGHGEIGDGTNTDRLEPVPVVGGLQFSTLTAGATYTCGITLNGAAYCWGQNTNNAQGGWLGDGTTIDRAVPVAVVGGHTFVTLTAGGLHTCGTTSSGGAYCWGWSLGGSSTTPVTVSGGLSFATLSAGDPMTCGLSTDSIAYCWGPNGYGQLGNGTFNDALAPVQVAGGLKLTALSTGGLFPSHTCALTPTGAAYCWGRNTDGEVGDGTAIQRTTPVAVVGGLSFATVTAGEGSSCGVTLAGVAYCWGKNVDGQLGSGSFNGSLAPVKVAGQP